MNPGALPQLAQRRLEGGTSGRFFRRLGARQMINHHPEFRNLIGNLDDVLEQGRATHAVQRQARLGERPQVGDKLRLRHFFGDLSPPQLCEPNTSKQQVLVQP